MKNIKKIILSTVLLIGLLFSNNIFALSLIYVNEDGSPSDYPNISIKLSEKEEKIIRIFKKVINNMAINSPEEYDKLYKILFNKITKEEEYKKYFNKPKTLAIFFKLLQHIVKKENSKEVNYKNVFGYNLEKLKENFPKIKMQMNNEGTIKHGRATEQIIEEKYLNTKWEENNKIELIIKKSDGTIDTHIGEDAHIEHIGGNFYMIGQYSCADLRYIIKETNEDGYLLEFGIYGLKFNDEKCRLNYDGDKEKGIEGIGKKALENVYNEIVDENGKLKDKQSQELIDKMHEAVKNF
ncbi:MAG: hypothetical protein N4A38_05850 [Candidatus Gracilibacteria bacterium]|nr:hypothetical protein [Candidatus Gracilibacteria bacterium]